MIDFDILVKIGWTALIGWNLRETVALGKKVVALETKMENGLAHRLQEMKEAIEKHVDGEEQRILRALARNPKSRTRRTDRKRVEYDDA